MRGQANNNHIVRKKKIFIATTLNCYFNPYLMFKIFLSKSNILNINFDPPSVVEDRQLAVLAAAGSACPDNDEEADTHAAAGAGNSGESRGSTRADNTKKRQQRCSNTTLNVIF